MGQLASPAVSLGVNELGESFSGQRGGKGRPSRCRTGPQAPQSGGRLLLLPWRGDSAVWGHCGCQPLPAVSHLLQDPGQCQGVVPALGTGMFVRNGMLHSFSLFRVPPHSLGSELACQDPQWGIGSSQGCVCVLWG